MEGWRGGSGFARSWRSEADGGREGAEVSPMRTRSPHPETMRRTPSRIARAFSKSFFFGDISFAAADAAAALLVWGAMARSSLNATMCLRSRSNEGKVPLFFSVPAV